MLRSKSTVKTALRRRPKPILRIIPELEIADPQPPAKGIFFQGRKERLCFLCITADLCHQFFYTRKLLLVPQPLDKAHFQRFTVEVTMKVEQVSFHQDLSTRKGGSDPHVDNPAQFHTAPADIGSIDSSLRKKLSSGRQICGRKSQPRPPACSLGHLSDQSIQAVEQRSHFIHSPLLQPLPDQGAADPVRTQFHRLGDVPLGSALLRETVQCGNGAGPIPAKRKSLPYEDLGNRQTRAQVLTHEFL